MVSGLEANPNKSEVFFIGVDDDMGLKFFLFCTFIISKNFSDEKEQPCVY